MSFCHVFSRSHAVHLHSLPLNDVDVVLRPGVVAVQAQSSPEVRPQVAVTGDKRANYFSEQKQEERGSQRTCISQDENQ